MAPLSCVWYQSCGGLALAPWPHTSAPDLCSFSTRSTGLLPACTLDLQWPWLNLEQQETNHSICKDAFSSQPWSFTNTILLLEQNLKISSVKSCLMSKKTSGPEILNSSQAKAHPWMHRVSFSAMVKDRSSQFPWDHVIQQKPAQLVTKSTEVAGQVRGQCQPLLRFDPFDAEKQQASLLSFSPFKMRATSFLSGDRSHR